MFGDLAQQINIPQNQIRLCDYAQIKTTTAAELFQDSSGNFVAAFGWLVRIGCGANADVLRNAFAADGERILGGDFASQEDRGVFFDENLFLKG